MSITLKGTLLPAAFITMLLQPASSKAGEKIAFHGYGEMHYNNSLEDGETDRMDNHRLVLGWSYAFNEKITLNAEIDYEHAATEMELEFAYVDFLIHDLFNVRTGAVLMPVGLLNEFHEPPLFYSVERPYAQKNIIPTTWQEGGAGFFGSYKGLLKYRAYIVSGLNAVDFKVKSGIRSGRGKVNESPANDLAGVGRLEITPARGLEIGFSGYGGNAAQNVDTIGTVNVGIMEADARFRRWGLELTGLFARVLLSDTDKLAAVTGEALGKTMQGWYAEAAYHAGQLFLPQEQDLVVMIRREYYNTQEQMASGLTADAKYENNITTAGISYLPIPEIALKLDVENWKDGNGDTRQQLNMALAFMY